MLATRYIIALCPATPIYLVKQDVPANRLFSRNAATVATETSRVKTEALVFDTFEAAMDVCKDITGWGGAQRVEQVAVEVPDTRQTLATDDDLCEVRDLCTSEWCDACEDAANADWESPRTTVTRAEKWIVKALKDRGLKVSTENRATEDDGTSPSNPLTVYAADHLGNTLQLDFDPMVDGFDITEATCLAETEAQHEETATCDGCGSDDGEPCGEGFALCAACRKQDDPNPPAMTFDSAWLDGILGRDDLTFDQTPLTAEQAKHARLALASALRRLVLDNAPRLASSALTEARDNT